MAAEIDHHYHHLHDHQALLESTSRSCPELSFDNQQIEYESVSSVSISSILDQGSISFGKYATEALEWEKRSVFPHDRFQEELEKFRNPGLVARKKAYFEEYYRKLRAMKALQAEQQKAVQLEACQNAENSTTLVQDNVNSTVTIADNNTVSNLNLSSSGCCVYDSEKVTEAQGGTRNFSTIKAGMKNRTSLSSSTVKAETSTKRTSLSQTSSSDGTKTVPKKSPVSSAVDHKANKPKKQVTGLNAKGTMASVGNKTMLESCRATKNASKESEKPKPTVRRVIQKNGNSLLPSKKSDPKVTSKIRRQIMEGCPSATVPNSLIAKDKQVSSFSSVRDCLVKPSTTSQGLAGKLPTRLSFNAQATKLLSSSSSIRTCQMEPSTTCKGLTGKLPTRSSVQVQCGKPVSSTSSRRTPQEKPNTTPKGLAGKLPTRSSVQVQCAKPVLSTSSMKIHPVKPTTSSEGLAGKLLLSSSSVHVPCAKPVSSSSRIRSRPLKLSTTPQGLVKKLPTKLPSVSKDEASSGGLRNLVKRSADLSSPSKSSQNIEAELGQRSLVQEGKRKEVKEKVVAELRRDHRAASSRGPRDLKPTSSSVSNISRTLREEPVTKISPQQSADKKRGRIDITTKSVCRQMTPRWR